MDASTATLPVGEGSHALLNLGAHNLAWRLYCPLTT